MTEKRILYLKLHLVHRKKESMYLKPLFARYYVLIRPSIFSKYEYSEVCRPGILSKYAKYEVIRPCIFSSYAYSEVVRLSIFSSYAYSEVVRPCIFSKYGNTEVIRPSRCCVKGIDGFCFSPFDIVKVIE